MKMRQQQTSWRLELAARRPLSVAAVGERLGYLSAAASACTGGPVELPAPRATGREP